MVKKSFWPSEILWQYPGDTCLHNDAKRPVARCIQLPIGLALGDRFELSQLRPITIP